MSFEQVLGSVGERLQRNASVKSVFGKPIERNGKTLIPVARVGFGLGGGSKPSRAGDKENGTEEGGGGGGGATPVGVFEVTDDSTRFIPIGAKKKLAGALLLGLLVGFLLGKRR